MALCDFDPKLKDLLMRETHLRLYRERLEPVWAKKEAALRAVEAARPFFLPVFSSGKRAEYEERLNAARRAVADLRAGMDVVDRVLPQVKKLIEEEIEDKLRAASPEYTRALAGRRQKEDWQRCLERFAEKIHAFTRALGNVRNHASSGYGRLANGYSTAAVRAFADAVTAAQVVENEVKFANKVADEQTKLFLENGFNLRPLPRLKETDYAAWVQRIAALPLAEAQVQFDELIEHAKKLYDAGIPELRDQAAGVDQAQELEVHSFLLVVWERLRAEVAPEIFAGDTEKVASETVEMFLAAAKQGAASRP